MTLKYQSGGTKTEVTKQAEKLAQLLNFVHVEHAVIYPEHQE
jgi:hypothetical protein